MADDRFDVIVVGAGNGGLVTAATTAKGGLKTLLLEKHNLPGGCATSFRRGRFEFETSLHELCSVGTEEKPDLVYDIFKGLDVKINWCYEHDLFRTIVLGKDGYDITLSAGKEEFIASFEKACPGSEAAIRELFRLRDNCNDAIAYIYKKKGKPNSLTMITKYADFMRMASHPAEEVFRALGLSDKAVNLLGTYWGYLGVPTDELNAFHYWNMMSSYILDGAAMPRYRSHELSLALVDCIEKNGGQVWLNSEVTGFLYDENGQANGVEVNHQEKYYAKQVVSNIIPNRVANLSPEKNVPERTRKLINARKFGLSAATIYIGLDCSREELGFKDYTVFVSGSKTAREQYDKRDLFIVNCLNTVIPDSSPAGTCTLFFTMPVFGEDIPQDLGPEGYVKWKNELAAKYIKSAEEALGISITPHIEEIEIATPVTLARYLGTPDGTMYGYRLSDWDSLMVRISSEAADATVSGLNYVGGHSVRGDGFSCAYYTGDMIGKRLVRKMKEVK